MICLTFRVEPIQAWDWEDYLGSNDDIPAFQTQTLGTSEIREMRVRDIKRRLTRKHGYSADEVGRMLDKEELIQALAFEEHKEREKELSNVKRYVIIKALIMTLIAIVVVLFWPLWVQIYEVASVNFVVYTDKKRYGANRCIELNSWKGMVGIILMGIVDALSAWLSLSVLLSWFMSSPYFFPTPNLSFRPAQFMGEKVSRGPLSKYGLNIAPMAFTWTFRFIQGQLENFTGRALAKAYQEQTKAARRMETPEERAARKAAKRAAKQAARDEIERQMAEDERKEKERRKEAAAKASFALFSTTSPSTTSTTTMEKNSTNLPHMVSNDHDGDDNSQVENETEAVHEMDELD